MRQVSTVSRSTSHALARLSDLFLRAKCLAVAAFRLRQDVNHQNARVRARGVPDVEGEVYTAIVGECPIGTGGLMAYAARGVEAIHAEIAMDTVLNAIGIYEGFEDALLKEFGIGERLPRKPFQFPDGDAEEPPLTAVLAILDAARSGAMDRDAYKWAAEHPKFSMPEIESLLRQFRVFKELRNCLAHSGGRPGLRLREAEKLAGDASVQELQRLGYSTESEQICVAMGAAEKLGDVLVRLIVTFDAMVLRTTFAEAHLIVRLDELLDGPLLLPCGGGKSAKETRRRKIRSLCRRVGVCLKYQTTRIEDLLRAEGLVAYGS